MYVARSVAAAGAVVAEGLRKRTGNS